MVNTFECKVKVMLGLVEMLGTSASNYPSKAIQSSSVLDLIFTPKYPFPSQMQFWEERQMFRFSEECHK